MDRFRYDPGVLTVSFLRLSDDFDNDYAANTVEDISGYKIFDVRAGNTDDAWIAFSRDADMAERIALLLNYDVRFK